MLNSEEDSIIPTLNIGDKATRTQTVTDEMIGTFAKLTDDFTFWVLPS